MIRIGVVGASGRTGRYVVEALQHHQEAKLHAAVVSPGSASLRKRVPGSDLEYTANLDELIGSDVVVEFSNPETSARVAQWCADRGTPVLLATTGHSPDQNRLVAECAERTAIGVTPNTSVGAAVLTALAGEAKKLLGDSFDIEVLDVHHRMKKDAPSGTARAIVSSIASSGEVVFGRTGLRQSGEVGVVALRGGDVVGDHTVYFLGAGERIEVTHRVSTRGVFGLGAVSLAIKLSRLNKGLYSASQLMKS